MPLNIIRNDISKVKADAIVNTANPLVAIGAGVDQAIYEAAGADQLLAERAKIGPMKPGQAAYTPAFNLDAKYIIHTVGPAWEGGDYGEYDAVASCYKESLRIADELECESIAFPLISTGTLGFPKDKALQIAIKEISSFLFEHDMKVYMVVYDKEAFVISGKAFAGVRTYIEEQDVKKPVGGTISYSQRRRDLFYHLTEEAARRKQFSSARRKPKLFEKYERDASYDLEEVIYDAMTEAEEEPMVVEQDMLSAPTLAGGMASSAFDLPNEPDDIVPSETFQELLFRHIDRKDLRDPEVYHRANIDRKLFSKLRNPNHTPSKNTAIALAIALELNLDETLDLIGRAGYTLSRASLFDLIVAYCIEHKIYNIYDVNILLFDYTEHDLS